MYWRRFQNISEAPLLKNTVEYDWYLSLILSNALLDFQQSGWMLLFNNFNNIVLLVLYQLVWRFIIIFVLENMLLFVWSYDFFTRYSRTINIFSTFFVFD